MRYVHLFLLAGLGFGTTHCKTTPSQSEVKAQNAKTRFMNYRFFSNSKAAYRKLDAPVEARSFNIKKNGVQYKYTAMSPESGASVSPAFRWRYVGIFRALELFSSRDKDWTNDIIAHEEVKCITLQTQEVEKMLAFREVQEALGSNQLQINFHQMFYGRRGQPVSPGNLAARYKVGVRSLASAKAHIDIPFIFLVASDRFVVSKRNKAKVSCIYRSADALAAAVIAKQKYVGPEPTPAF